MDIAHDAPLEGSYKKIDRSGLFWSPAPQDSGRIISPSPPFPDKMSHYLSVMPGHMHVPYPYYPTTLRQFYLPTVGVWEGLGGTPEGAAIAAADSWSKVIEFLKRELKVR